MQCRCNTAASALLLPLSFALRVPVRGGEGAQGAPEGGRPRWSARAVGRSLFSSFFVRSEGDGEQNEREVRLSE